MGSGVDMRGIARYGVIKVCFKLVALVVLAALAGWVIVT